MRHLRTKKVWGVAGILLILGIGWWIWKGTDSSSSEKKPQTPDALPELTEEEEQEELQLIFGTLAPQLKAKDLGDTIEGYLYLNDYALTVNSKDVRMKDTDGVGDRIVWTDRTSKDLQLVEMTDDEFYVFLEKMDGSPFIRTGLDTVFVYFERSKTIQGYDGKTHVVKINGDGTIEEIFEAKGVHDRILLDKEGNLIVVEKIFMDPYGQYPTPLKPYEQHFRKYESGKWRTIQVKQKFPAEELAEQIANEKDNEKNGE